MKIMGFDKMSLVDWPGRVAAVVFTGSCNMDCFYCHNRAELRNDEHACSQWDSDKVLSHLKKRARVLDGVVISGGEPTLQKHLKDFIIAVRELGLDIKLDTNGSRPEIVKDLLNSGLIDFIAMDIKAPKARYEELTDSKINGDKVEQTIQLLMHGADGNGPVVDYEFRTTCIPQLAEEDLLSMLQWIDGAENYALQQYRQLNESMRTSDIRHHIKPHQMNWFDRAVELAGPYIKNLTLRGVEGYAVRELGA